MSRLPVLVLPGYANSGPLHWQSRWERADARFSRVAMPDWDRAFRNGWCLALDRAVEAARGPVLIAGHSLGTLTTAWWATRYARPAALAKVRGALLVALPDPDGPAFPADAYGFGPVPYERLPFPTCVVASSDDPYGSLAFARNCANAWGSAFQDIGPRGHINADSGLGDWPEARGWLDALARRD
ncbi:MULTISPECIES: RBBP9/YdeN family alpha/beta hydrolase [Burkholderia]|jgi:predicted alpha/beta hydrolase family esterase|uniref:Alpha/beta hydrolase n=2 Tax=Burkholderia contaminans TaxID=488447 RepID=A0A1E3FXZ9_9BURK|nr:MULTISPECIES: alpha/beta hydrolase [Burkholderia]UTP20988.1 alpha/beta hydrolase [Burkholderia sp. FXe9]KKL40335.1 alpha/beta hydrolase, PF06821 family protein [Burkholderia contaminans LMG 23361]MBA9831479.1 alpha/beta hydrolase [Burkholderia contaminans]MBA9840041.1 alpha/beta hydrolase [Burkholderia contaminans]MBA9863428.1 alpha/beta hydrolase [Burkholderia contaminans]